MTVKDVKLKSESFFPISHGVLELQRKNLRGADSAPPPAEIGLTRNRWSFSNPSILSDLIEKKLMIYSKQFS